MTTFTVEATKRILLRTTIEAENIEEAQKIADELLVEDFEEIGTDFTETYLG
jgi:hypothetical protein